MNGGANASGRSSGSALKLVGPTKSALYIVQMQVSRPCRRRVSIKDLGTLGAVAEQYSGDALSRIPIYPEAWNSYKSVQRMVQEELYSSHIMRKTSFGYVMPASNYARYSEIRDRVTERINDHEIPALRSGWQAAEETFRQAVDAIFEEMVKDAELQWEDIAQDREKVLDVFPSIGSLSRFSLNCVRMERVESLDEASRNDPIVLAERQDMAENFMAEISSELPAHLVLAYDAVAKIMTTGAAITKANRKTTRAVHYQWFDESLASIDTSIEFWRGYSNNTDNDNQCLEVLVAMKTAVRKYLLELKATLGENTHTGTKRAELRSQAYADLQSSLRNLDEEKGIPRLVAECGSGADNLMRQIYPENSLIENLARIKQDIEALEKLPEDADQDIEGDLAELRAEQEYLTQQLQACMDLFGASFGADADEIGELEPPTQSQPAVVDTLGDDEAPESPEPAEPEEDSQAADDSPAIDLDDIEVPF